MTIFDENCEEIYKKGPISKWKLICGFHQRDHSLLKLPFFDKNVFYVVDIHTGHG